MIKVYTDGSCLENPGKGGWAAIIINDSRRIEIKGSKENTTNNQILKIKNYFIKYKFSIKNKKIGLLY